MEYTYTLKFKPTGQLYHGSRTSKHADPTELLVKYFTSSRIVKELIKTHGPDSFEIINITTYPDGGAYQAETQFLTENNCAASADWLNQSDNTTNTYHNSSLVKERMLKKYGVEHNSKLSSTRRKISEKAKNRWKTDEYRNSIIQSFNTSWGVDHPMKTEVVSNKVKATCIEKYGVSNVFAADDVKKKIHNVFIERYGDHPKRTQAVKDKCKSNLLSSYGVEHYSKTADFKNKISEAWSSKSKEEIEQIKKKSSSVRANDPILECPHCKKLIKNRGLFNRWHNDNCKDKT